MPQLPKKLRKLIFVEDSEHDYEVFLWALRKSQIQCEVQHFDNGDDALEHITALKNQVHNDYPALLLLDLNLPGTDGRTMLQELKSDPDLQLLPVVIFSSSANPRDLVECYNKGANAYVLKPLDMRQLQECVTSMLNYWLNVNTCCHDVC